MRRTVRELLPFILLLTLMGLGLYNEIDYRMSAAGWPPDTWNDPAQIQIREAAVQPGDDFKGRGLVLLEMDRPGSIHWGPHFFPILYFDYRANLGYDMMNDARPFGVPIVNEYGHWITPRMLALLAAAFYDERDEIHRAAQVPRVFRPNLARLMGVSVVVSDREIPGETKLYEGRGKDHPLILSRVDGTNLGQFSPTRTVLARDAREILDRLRDPDFDGRDLAVVEAPIPDSLVGAENVRVRFDRGPSLRVTARSPGTSLLILPIGWSACLRAEGEGLKDMFPVNLAQTGLLITGDAVVDIRYRYGLLSGTACRERDLKAAKALDLEAAATGRLFRDGVVGAE